MTMQRTPLLLSRLMDRGALLCPDEEIVTKTAVGGPSARPTPRVATARTSWRGALRDCGIREGDRVASFLWNSHRHLEMYHAVPSMGAVLHTLNIRLRRATSSTSSITPPTA